MTAAGLSSVTEAPLPSRIGGGVHGVDMDACGCTDETRTRLNLSTSRITGKDAPKFLSLS